MNASRRGIHTAVAAVLAIMACARANAVVLFDTFEPGNDYDTSVGWKIGFPGEGWDQGHSFAFTGTQSYRLESVELAVAIKEGHNALDVWLMSDTGGLPGTIMESFSFVNAMKPFDGMLVPPLMGYSTLHPVLAPETSYWLVASAPDDESTSAAWYWNSAELYGLHAKRAFDLGWRVVTDPLDPLAAFRIAGTPCVPHAPVPGAILLGAIGVSVVAGLRRRRIL